MSLSPGRVACIMSVALFSVSVWAADVVVIVNKENANTVDRELVVKIYTGEAKNWPNGGHVFALDQGEASSVRAELYSSMLGKNAANMKALWAQKIFSGSALPPKVIGTDAEVKKLVAGNKNAIGYIKASSVDDTVKVVVK